MTDKKPDKQSIDWGALIADHPLFDAIDAKEREFLLSDKVSRKHVLDAGKVVLKQNETGNSLFIVCEGAVSVTLEGPDGETIELYTLTGGEVFGEMSLFGQHLRAATLVTAEPCKLLEIAGDEFLVLMQKHHEIAVYLLGKLSQRLRHTDDLILSRRISGIDSSVAELKSRLEVAIETTDAKLAAAQTTFDQISNSANQVIESAGRARTRMTWIVSTVGGVLTILASMGVTFGVWSLDSAKQELRQELKSTNQEMKIIRAEMSLTAERTQGLEDKAADHVVNAGAAAAAARSSAGEAEDSAGNAEDSAGNAEDSAGNAEDSAGNAEDSALKANASVDQANKAVGRLEAINRRAAELLLETEAINQRVTEAQQEIFNVKYDGILTRFIAAVETPGFADTSPDPKTAEDYLECINADNQPDIRATLVEFLHDEIRRRDKNPAIRAVLDGSLTEFQIRMSDEAQVATYYFLTLISILENKPEKSAEYEKQIALRSQEDRSYFDDILGAEFDSAMFSQILTYPETDANLKQRQQDALARLYDALKRSS